MASSSTGPYQEARVGKGPLSAPPDCQRIYFPVVIELGSLSCRLLAASHSQLLAIWPFIPSEVGAVEGLRQRRGVVWYKKEGGVKIAIDFFGCSLSLSSTTLHKTHRYTHAQEEAEAVPLCPEGPKRHLPTAGAQRIPVEEGKGPRGALPNDVAIAGSSFHHPFLKIIPS